MGPVLLQVNAVYAELVTAEAMDKVADAADAADAAPPTPSPKRRRDGDVEDTKIQVNLEDWELETDRETAKGVRFSPRRGNVIFASARDGWAFRCVGCYYPHPHAPCACCPGECVPYIHHCWVFSRVGSNCHTCHCVRVHFVCVAFSKVWRRLRPCGLRSLA